MITHNLNDENALADLPERVAALERNAQGRHMSVTDGLFRFYGGKLLGLAGAVFEWIGNFTLTGLFTAIGRSVFRGPVEITGEDGTLDVAADAKFSGDVSIEEKLDVTAETTLRALVTLLHDLLVQGAGKITLEGAIAMVLQNGTATFANGAQLRGSEGGVTLDGGGGAIVQITLGNAAMVSGANSVSVDGIRTTVAGPALVTGNAVLDAHLFASGLPVAPLTGVPSGALVREPTTGRIYVAL